MLLSFVILFYWFFSIIFRIPKRGEIRNAWINAISKFQQFDFFSTHFLVCDRHFSIDDLKFQKGNRKLKSQEVVPTIFDVISNFDDNYTQPHSPIVKKTDGKMICSIKNCQHVLKIHEEISYFR